MMKNPEHVSRRAFGRYLLGAGAFPAAGMPAPFGAAWLGGGAEGSLQMVERLGVLIGSCPLPGERRTDDVVPAQASGLQVSRDRWLLLYATRGFRGVDDDRSIVYQLRRGSPDGPVLREGFMARSRDDWDPFGTGEALVKQHGHPVVFGVPRGALRDGRPIPQANVFVAKWRLVARRLDRQRDYLEHSTSDRKLAECTQDVEWLQFRLNEKEDDIEVLQPAAVMRQKGFESGRAFCSGERVRWMNQTFTPAVPFNPDATEWADCSHFDGGRVAALKYTFNSQRRLYEWTATGPFLSDPRRGLSEASLARWGDRWVIAARTAGDGVAWVSTDNPFAATPRPRFTTSPAGSAPRTLFLCPDGVLRLFTGDTSVSRSRNARDPLYCWDVDPGDHFALSNRRLIFDSAGAKLPIRPVAVPKIDMCKVLPPQGRTQFLVFRVSLRGYNHPYVGGSGKPNGIPIINKEEKACCGLYCARITYGAVVPPSWECRLPGPPR
jgi:hypothetical protein